MFCALPFAAVAQSEDQESGLSLRDRLAENIDVSGQLEIEWAPQLRDGNSQKAEAILEPEFEVKLPWDLDLTAVARLRADVFDRLEPGSPPQPTVAWPSRRVLIGDQIDAELREFYVESTVGETYLTIGKQHVVWGKADGLKVIDVVNPQSFREFIFDDFDDSRIPLWTVNAEIPIKDFNLQLLWIPDLSYHELPPRRRDLLAD